MGCKKYRVRTVDTVLGHYAAKNEMEAIEKGIAAHKGVHDFEGQTFYVHKAKTQTPEVTIG